MASGTSYPLATIYGTLNNIPGETSGLGQTGEVLFHGAIEVDGRQVYGLFRYRGPGMLEKLLLRGDPVPYSGGGTAGPMSQGFGTGAPGLFFFRMLVLDGAFADGLYAADILPPTVSAVADPSVLRTPNGRLRPDPAAVRITYPRVEGDRAGADPDVPILVEAKKEYAALR